MNRYETRGDLFALLHIIEQVPLLVLGAIILVIGYVVQGR
jgi:hypothetical protein